MSDPNVGMGIGEIDIEALTSSLDELDLDENLREFEAVQDLEPEAIQEIVIEDELPVEIEAAIEHASAKEAIYAAAPTSEVSEPGEAPSPKERKKREASATKEKAPKIVRDLSALPAEVFVLDSVSADPEAWKAQVLSRRPTQKKVAEKFDNLFQSLAANRQPSVYTMACFRALKSGAGVKMSDLIGVLISGGGAKPYSPGTARSQAGQIGNLFNSLGVVTKISGVYTRNPDSKIADRLEALDVAA